MLNKWYMVHIEKNGSYLSQASSCMVSFITNNIENTYTRWQSLSFRCFSVYLYSVNAKCRRNFRAWKTNETQRQKAALQFLTIQTVSFHIGSYCSITLDFQVIAMTVDQTCFYCTHCFLTAVLLALFWYLCSPRNCKLKCCTCTLQPVLCMLICKCVNNVHSMGARALFEPTIVTTLDNKKI
jgi:hypothetical protein